MRQIDLLWEYQNLDLAIDKYEAEKKNSPLRNRLLKLKKHMVEQQKYLMTLDDEANKKNNQFNKINHECEAVSNTINNNRQRIEDGEIKTTKQLDEMKENAAQLMDRIDKKEIELQKLLKDLEELSTKLEEIRAVLIKAQKEYNEVKIEYDKEMSEWNNEYNEIKEKYEELQKEIDKRLLSKYNNLKINRSSAITIIKENRCGGCNMTLASLVIQNVIDGERIVECENCGRILYIEKAQDVS